jgi:hypothetical protein
MGGIEVRAMDAAELKASGVDRWGIWEKEPSEFDWVYTDEERCYIIEGKARIVTDRGSVEIKKGDYVVLPRGLACRWQVTEGIRKYYSFV